MEALHAVCVEMYNELSAIIIKFHFHLQGFELLDGYALQFGLRVMHA